MNVDPTRTLATWATLLAAAAGIIVGYLHIVRSGVDPRADGVSAYALTRFGGLYRVQVVATGTAALFLTAALFAAELASGIALVLLAAFGVSRILIARYPTDPRGTTSLSRRGRYHVILATITFLTIAVAAPSLSGTLATSAGWTGPGDVLTVLAWATTAFVVGIFASNTMPATRRVFGLVERGAYAGMLAWLVVAAAGVTARV